MKDSAIDLGVAQWALVGIAVIILLRKVYVANRRMHLRNLWKTKQCKASNSAGLRRVVSLLGKIKSGQILESQLEDFRTLGADTIDSNLLWQRLILTSNPENVKTALAKQVKSWSIGVRGPAFKPLLGHGIFASEGKRWEQSRSMLKPQFSRDQISHVRMLEPHLMTLVKLIREYHNHTVDIQPLFHKLTLDASSEFLFGESIGSLEFDSIDSAKQFEDLQKRKAFDESLSFLQEYLIRRAALLDMYWLLNSSQFKHHVNVIHDFVLDFINEAKQASETGKIKQKYIFLHELMKLTRDPVVLRDEVLNIMLAGRSTTASLLSSLLYELSQNPEVWKKLRTEVFNDFGRGETSAEIEGITFEKLSRSAYLRHVVNETLRLHPPVPSNTRRATEDTWLPRGGGKEGLEPLFIRKGDILVLSNYSMHRQPQYFGEDALVFRPERWNELHQVAWAFIPFGTGPRVCLGQKYALTEASYVMVRFAQLFSRIEFQGPYKHPPNVKSTATIQYMDGVKVSFFE